MMKGNLAGTAAQLTKASKSLSDFDAVLSHLADMNPKYLEQFHNRATKLVTPTIRSFLAVNYSSSGLAVKTGALYKYSVTLANIIAGGTRSTDGFNIGSIFIKMGNNAPAHVYASAGVFRYGGVHGTRTAVLASASQLGVGSKLGLGGGKQRRRVKKSMSKLANHGVTTAAGVTYIKPRPPFFELTLSQVETVAEQYQAAFVRIANAFLNVRALKHGK